MPGENPFRTARTRVIAVASGKGGVGKSSVTTNLSVALAQMGKDVAAIDADVWGFSMPRMLGVENGPELTDENLMIPPSGHGVRLLSMGFFVPEDQAVIWRGPMLHKALEQFLTDVAWGEPDYLVIDMPPGTGDVSLSMSQFLPRAEVVIVTTPQPAAQAVAQRAAAMAEKVELDVIGVVENMSYLACPHCPAEDDHRLEVFGSGGGARVAATLSERFGYDVPVLGEVPLDIRLREGGDVGAPIVIEQPDAPAAQALTAIAHELVSKGRGLAGMQLGLTPAGR